MLLASSAWDENPIIQPQIPYENQYRIYLDEITPNDISTISKNFLDNKEYIVYIMNYNLDIDINKLIAQLFNVENLCIETPQKLNISMLPPKLKNYNALYYHNIAKFPDTLESYIVGFINSQPIIIPDNLPDKNILICLSGEYLTSSFYNLSSHITNITIQVDTLGMNIDMWPINLQYLDLWIKHTDDMNWSIGTLPYGLKSFYFKCESYNHIIEFPPTLKKLEFYSINEYKYLDNLNTLPNNIISLRLKYYYNNNRNENHILKLPDSCIEFNYVGCPIYIIHKLQSKYPNVLINSNFC